MPSLLFSGTKSPPARSVLRTTGRGSQYGQAAGRASYRTGPRGPPAVAKANPGEGPGRAGAGVPAPAGSSQEARDRGQVQKFSRQPCVQGHQFEIITHFFFTAIGTVVNPTSEHV